MWWYFCDEVSCEEVRSGVGVGWDREEEVGILGIWFIFNYV